MAITNFIPEIWNSEILWAFRESAIAANLVNRDYEGDARRGNTVKITTGVPITIKDYAAGVLPDDPTGTIARTTAPDAISTTQVDLLIDKEKSFDFLVDDIDRVQAAGSLGGFTVSAGEGLAEDADKAILAGLYAATTPITAAAMGTGKLAWDKIRDLRKALDKAKVPNSGRNLVINAEFAAVLLGDDSKLTSVDTSGSPAGLRDAILGRILGFNVYQTENLPNVAKAQAIAFHKSAFAYVSQIAETEGMRHDDSFSDRIRGLHVYGLKAVRPTAIAAFTAS